MKIRLALLDSDRDYLERIVTAFGTRYSEKFEIYAFTDPELCIETVRESKIDVLVADASFEINTILLPSNCSFAYFVASAEIESFRDQPAICKYRKADLIYKQILSIYAEKIQGITGLRMEDDQCRVIGFGSAAGGAGASTMAASCALHYAMNGKKVLYLNLERFGSSDLFFSADGQFDMSDVVFALKEQKANFSLKLESCVRQDARGVYFFEKPKVALDMMELSAEENLRLLRELRLSGSYDYIIVDSDFNIDKDHIDIYRSMHEIVITVDGSEIGNQKTISMLQALRIKEENVEVPLLKRMSYIYNRFSNKTGRPLGEVDIRNLGGIPRYEHATVQQILSQVAEKEIFDEILRGDF